MIIVIVGVRPGEAKCEPCWYVILFVLVLLYIGVPVFSSGVVCTSQLRPNTTIDFSFGYISLPSEFHTLLPPCMWVSSLSLGWFFTILITILLFSGIGGRGSCRIFLIVIITLNLVFWALALTDGIFTFTHYATGGTYVNGVIVTILQCAAVLENIILLAALTIRNNGYISF
eukprot:TRINITY_DN10775_c0_g1_i1.p1 TRINITY_DN10775_c0_g1~~TRINITY_DN10775_c0_g1_i1.p1  ORF type:complete len:172 (-),score=17.26 TRINITY_DN10775_c0_g1_i1:51-566(-)